MRDRTTLRFARCGLTAVTGRAAPDAAQWTGRMKRLLAVLLLFAVATPAAAQWLDRPWPGIPRTADGKPNLTAPVRADPLRPAPPETEVTELPIAAPRERAEAGIAAAQTLPLRPLAREGR